MQRIFKVRHLILAVMCLMYFIAYIDRVNILVAGPLIKQEFGLSPTQLGIVFSAFAYPYAAMQIFGGWCADRFGPRLVLTVLSIVWALATILCGFAWGLTSLLMFRFVLGIGEGGAIAPPAAIGNAVNDALRGLGVEMLQSPITPRRIVEGILAARDAQRPAA